MPDQNAERTEYFTVDDEKSKQFDKVWDSPHGRFAYFRTINNIPIAKRYIAVSFSFFLIGGFMALLMRWQLVEPRNDFVDVETYNQLFSMHGTTMMFLFVIPFIEAVANYFMPLQLGTRDLPFPRLTTLALWTYIWGGIFIFASFLFGVAPAGGWFAYVPMTNRQFMPGLGMDFWDIGLSVAEIAALGAAAEIIISILRMRAPGMSLQKMPIFAWAMLITAFMIVFAFTPLIVATAMLEFDRKGVTSFFVPEFGGEPLLWQHLFWIFGHPEVYIMFLPAIGVVSQIVPVFARRPLVSYTLVVVSLLATAFISFGLWVHHMFTTGLSPTAYGFFTAASVLIAIPTGVQIFIWIATLWSGRPIFKTPLLFVIGFIVIFVLGGVTGVMVAVVPFDQQVHDTYFVVAHLHYVLIGGVVFPFYAGLYYWLPKITGRMLSERLGKINFWIMFIFFNVAFFPMHITGLLGMPRRVHTYEPGMGWETLNIISTIGAFGFAIGAVLLVVNFLWSLKRGKRAGDNPWNADTLEWWEGSPPPNAQFKIIPFIRDRHPLWRQSSFDPKNEKERKIMEPLHSAPLGWRGALVVSVMEARPVGIVQMPGPTVWPFIMSVGFVVIFAAALLEHLWVLVAGLTITAVSLYGWFRPLDIEKKAEEEIGTDSREDKLPLGVAGPVSNGWWGTLVFLLIFGIALLTLIGSLFYLADGPREWPEPPALQPGLIITGVMLALGIASYLFARAVRRGQLGLRRIALLAALVLSVAAVWLLYDAYDGTGLTAKESAYASAFIGLTAFLWATFSVMLVMVGSSALWAFRAKHDPRGFAVALNAELVGYFLVASWLLVFASLYVVPRVW